MKKTRKTKVTLAVTIHELPPGWRPHQALAWLKSAIAVAASTPETDGVEMGEITARVASTVDHTKYDASVGGRRGVQDAEV